MKIQFHFTTKIEKQARNALKYTVVSDFTLNTSSDYEGTSAFY